MKNFYLLVYLCAYLSVNCQQIDLEENRKIDTIKIYHENGNLYFEGCIYKNINSYRNWWYDKIGLWTIYNRNGKLSYVGEYRNGGGSVKIGDWLLYDENENVVGKINHTYTKKESAVDLNGLLIINKSNISFSSAKNKFEAYNSTEDGKSYRVIDFKDNSPIYDANLKKRNTDLKIVRGGWGELEIKFHKKVKLIMVDFNDAGCGTPFTTFNLRKNKKKTILSHRNNSLESNNIIFNESELLKNMKFFEIIHCEGTTGRVLIIYK